MVVITHNKFLPVEVVNWLKGFSPLTGIMVVITEKKMAKKLFFVGFSPLTGIMVVITYLNEALVFGQVLVSVP